MLAGGLEVGVPGLALDRPDQQLAEAPGEARRRRGEIVLQLLPDEGLVGVVVGRVTEARQAERAIRILSSQASAADEEIEHHGEDDLERKAEEGEGLEVGQLGHLARLPEGREPEARGLPVVALPEHVRRGRVGAGEALELAAGEAEADEAEAEEQREDDARAPPQSGAGLRLRLLLRVTEGGEALVRLSRDTREVARRKVELHAVAPARGDAVLVEAHPEGRRVALAAVGDEVALVDPRLRAQARRGRVLERERSRPRRGHREEADDERLVVERRVPLDGRPVEHGEGRAVRPARERHEAGGGEVGVVGEGVGGLARAPTARRPRGRRRSGGPRRA